MAEIFISYKSERRPAARHLARVLELHGYSVWYDYGLLPGEEFEPRLMGELDASQVVVALWCSMSVSSSWVLKEATAARAASKLLPCWLERATPPDPFHKDDIVDLTPDMWDGSPNSDALYRLLAGVGDRLGRQPRADFEKLREYVETWRGFGSPSLRTFALGEPLAARAEPPAKGRAGLGPIPDAMPPDTRELWFKAQGGDAAAMCEIARRYEFGRRGLPRDTAEALRLYRIALESGEPEAQTCMGWIHEQGRYGVDLDEVAAARLYRLAADQGNARAQSNLGVMYLEGRGGLAQSDVEAVRWSQRSAAQGFAGAERNLGAMYKAGRGGLPQDDGEAVRLFRLAAERGDAPAQFNLGVMYEEGRGGLVQDLEEARRLFQQAGDAGVGLARERLERLTGRTSG